MPLEEPGSRPCMYMTGKVRFSQASTSSHSPAISLACTTQGQRFRLFPLVFSSESLKLMIFHCFLVFRFSMECINLPLGRILYKYIPNLVLNQCPLFSFACPHSFPHYYSSCHRLLGSKVFPHIISMNPHHGYVRVLPMLGMQRAS